MAKSSSRNYSKLTIKKLYALSGNKCAFPSCSVTFVNSEGDVNFSNICHIEDANQDLYKSDRYNPKMTDAERADYNNLMLLCPNHHIETNNTAIYTVEVLRDMKRKHEANVRQLISGQNLLTKNPSALNIVIGYIGKNLFNGSTLEEPTTAPNPDKKIKFNNIVRYKSIIEEYRIYQGKLSRIYEEIEKAGSTKKELVLKNINTLYLREKGKYTSQHEILENADNIIESIEHELWKVIENSGNYNADMQIESIEISLLVILVDAFMRCSILEEPPNV
ncbi:MAG: ABC-three component system protein [Cyclobacteriaceae bacterium]